MAKRIERIPSSQVAALIADPNTVTRSATVKVTKETDGPVTLLQKFQKYYKATVAVVGSDCESLDRLTCAHRDRG